MEKYLKIATALLFASTLALGGISFNLYQENRVLENETQTLNSSLEDLNSEIKEVKERGFSFGAPAITDEYVRFELERFPALGNESSSNTAIVFCSFSIEDCQDFYNKKYDQIFQQELSMGRYRFYAIQKAGSMSSSAFEVSRCVEEIGSDRAYWDFFFSVYENADVLAMHDREEMLDHAERVTDLERSNLDDCIEANNFVQERSNYLDDRNSPYLSNEMGMMYINENKVLFNPDMDLPLNFGGEVVDPSQDNNRVLYLMKSNFEEG